MAVAGAVAAAQAIKASGTIVHVESRVFEHIVSWQDEPLVIRSEGSRFGGRFRYLTSYKGFAFYTKSATPLHIAGKAKLIDVKKIWIPG
ncbi:MAG: hypothetical protein V3W35_04655 [Gemmatimonadota bacterium]|nr:hypothetical protein [Gemmatimonadota bacterium]